jgi:hypothetical protein
MSHLSQALLRRGLLCKALFFEAALARAGAIKQMFDNQVGGLFYIQ